MATLVGTPAASTTASFHIDLDAVETGLPLDALTRFASVSGIDLKLVYDVVIPARTLKHRRARQQNLSLEESDKLARLMRVYDHAVRVFGNPDKALRWLTRPKDRFDGRSPLVMVRTDIGGRLVEGMLWQIADGMFV